MENATDILAGSEPGTYALFDTNQGAFVVRLFTDKAPKTTANFIGLAEGTKPFTNPKTGKKEQHPFYDGLVFHRVIAGFMIQGGCPEGTGRGGPGYKFTDEFHRDLRHSKPGILSMANSGPNTNGSQFFITEKPTPWLTNHHTIFGEVVEGLDLIPKITGVARDRNDRPQTPIVIHKLEIVRAS